MARRLFAGLWLTVALGLLPSMAAAQDEASLEIFCNTDGAVVRVDGRQVATTPMIEPVMVSPGGHLIRVEKPGFIAFEELVVFFEDDEIMLDVELLPFAGIVRIVTAEPGAAVLIDGERVGVTPFEGEVPVGPHEIQVSRAQHESWSTSARINAGQEYFFEALLIPIPEETEIIVVEETPFYRQWWFWTGAAVVIGGGVAAALLLSEDEQAPPVDILLELPLFR
jgi:hypothetical protein